MSEVPRNWRTVYQSFTGVQRNEELKDIYGMLPDRSTKQLGTVGKLSFKGGELVYESTASPDTINERLSIVAETEQRRASHRLTTTLRERHTALLTYTCTTQASRDYLNHRFKKLSVEGVDKTAIGCTEEFIVSEGRTFLWDPMSTGMFGEDSAGVVEQSLYQRVSAIQLRVHNMVGDLADKMPQIVEDIRKLRGRQPRDEKTEIDPSLIENPKFTQEEKFMQDLLTRWRQEYIARYQNEP